MFLGEYQYSLDAKSRLTIPAKYRELLAPTLVITRNPSEPCLMVLPLPQWNTLTGKLSGLPMTDPVSALLRRALYTAAEDVKADSQGRILLNQRLREYAHIEADVLIAGVYTHLELWNPKLWEERVMAQVNNSDVTGQMFAALGI
jgi:MraZ protein